jgi:hypothetical protein
MLRKFFSALAIACALSGSALAQQATITMPVTNPVPGVNFTYQLLASNWLNPALSAIVGQFSGPTAPPNPKLDQLWMDTATTPFIQNIFDGSTWVELGTLNPSNHLFAPVVGASINSTLQLSGGLLGVNLGDNFTWTGSNTFNSTMLFGGVGNGRLDDDSSVIGSPASMWFPTFFTNPGHGVVHRLNRLMVGEAALGSSDIPMSTPDWLETLITNTTSVSQLVSISITGQSGITGAARTSDFRTAFPTSGASQGSEGVNGFAENDDDGSGNPIATGSFFLGARIAGNTGITLGSQVSVMTEGTVTDITPEGGVLAGQTIADLVTSFNTPSGPFTANESAGIVVGAGAVSGGDTGPVLRKGYVTLADALDPTVGAGGDGVAFEQEIGQSIRWLNPSNGVDAELWGFSNGIAIDGQSSAGQLELCNVGTNPGCGMIGANQFVMFEVSSTTGTPGMNITDAGVITAPLYVNCTTLATNSSGELTCNGSVP